MKSSFCRPPSDPPVQSSHLWREQTALTAHLQRVPRRWALSLQVEPARTLAGPGVTAAWTSRPPSPSRCHCPTGMCPVEQIFIIKTHCQKLLFEFFLILQPKEQILQAQGIVRPKNSFATGMCFSRLGANYAWLRRASLGM